MNEYLLLSMSKIVQRMAVRPLVLAFRDVLDVRRVIGILEERRPASLDQAANFVIPILENRSG